MYEEFKIREIEIVESTMFGIFADGSFDEKLE